MYTRRPEGLLFTTLISVSPAATSYVPHGVVSPVFVSSAPYSTEPAFSARTLMDIVSMATLVSRLAMHAPALTNIPRIGSGANNTGRVSFSVFPASSARLITFLLVSSIAHVRNCPLPKTLLMVALIPTSKGMIAHWYVSSVRTSPDTYFPISVPVLILPSTSEYVVSLFPPTFWSNPIHSSLEVLATAVSYLP